MNPPEPAGLSTKEGIKAVFFQGAAAWNRRDLDGYLATYADGDHVRWVSGGHMTIGKAAIREALAPRFASPEPMGTLTIKKLQIEIQTLTDALVFGRFHLQFEEEAIAGVFTVHLQQVDGRWLMVSDHASVVG